MAILTRVGVVELVLHKAIVVRKDSDKSSDRRETKKQKFLAQCHEI